MITEKDLLEAMDAASDADLLHCERRAAAPSGRRVARFLSMAAILCLIVAAAGVSLMIPKKAAAPPSPEAPVTVQEPNIPKEELPMTNAKPPMQELELPAEPEEIIPEKEVVGAQTHQISPTEMPILFHWNEVAVGAETVTNLVPEDKNPLSYHPMTAEQLTAFVPESIRDRIGSPNLSESTVAADGELFWTASWFDREDGSSIKVALADTRSLAPELQSQELTTVEGIDFLCWIERPDPVGSSYRLCAEACLDDIPIYVLLCSTENPDFAADEADFAQILRAYAKQGRPDLSLFPGVTWESGLNETISPEEAMADATYGSFVPTWMTYTEEGFSGSALRQRSRENEVDVLRVIWGDTAGNSLHWLIRSRDNDTDHRTVHSWETELYDLSLYAMPRSEFVPADLQNIVENPVLLVSELTETVFLRRVEYLGMETGSTPCLRFSLLFRDTTAGDVEVQIISTGLAPEVIWGFLRELPVLEGWELQNQTFVSKQGLAVLRVVPELADCVEVDQSYTLYIPVTDEFGEFPDVAYAFFDQSQKNWGAGGLVWMIRAYPIEELEDFLSYDAESGEQDYILQHHFLGCDETFFYLLTTVNPTPFGVAQFDAENPESVNSYLAFMLTGMEVLEGFIEQNALQPVEGVTDWQMWYETYRIGKVAEIADLLTAAESASKS